MYKNLLPGLCLLLMSLFSIHSISAQDGSIQYQYKDFRFPNIDRKALEGDFSLFTNGSYGTNYLPVNNTKSSNSNFSHRILLNYSRFRNLEKIQAFENLSFNHAFSRTGSSNSGFNNPSSSVSGTFEMLPQYQSDYRYYYTPDKFIGYEMDIYSDFDYEFSQNRITQNRTEETRLDMRISPSFIFGWGRLEPISDVFLAKFMVDDMLAEGILDQELTQEELFELGSTMAFVRNQRIFDFRRLRMYELSEIDRWFAESGLVTTQDFRYFTVLNDNWLYSYRNTRFSGRRTTIGLTPFVNWLTEFGPNPPQRASLGLNLSGDYQLHKPINQYWQSIFEVSGGVSLVCSQCAEDSLNALAPFVRVSQTYGWYPNSRTRIGSSAFLNYRQSFLIEQKFLNTFSSVSAGINANVDYFINFQFRVRGNISYTMNLTDNSSQSNNTFDFTSSSIGFFSNVSFLYTFF